MSALRSWLLVLPLAGACSAPPAASKEPAGPAVPGPPGPTAPPGATTPDPIPLPPSGKHVGATPYEGGIEVRVWAPNAKSVAVVGELAGDPKDPKSGRRALAAEAGTGMFAARIDGAKSGQHYRFGITSSDGTEVLRADPRARAYDGGDSLVVDPRSYVWKTKSFTPPARDAAIVYELHVGSFNAPGGVNSGTFTSAIEKLDALAELGVNTVELMPVAGHGGSGWGYGPQQWYATQPEYGSPDEMRHFVDEAHARGIAVVLDVVFNHYAGSPSAPLRCFEGPCPNGSSGIYFFEQDPYRRTPWGPRPNFAQKEVADFFTDNVFAWTTEYKVDGFRHDSVSNVRAIDGQGTVPGGVELLRRMNEVTEAARPGALLIAEDLKGAATVTASRASGGLGFVAQWDGGFGWSVAGAASAASDDARNIGAVRDSIQNSYNGDGFERLLYVETHDTAGNSGARLPVLIDAANPRSLAARKRAILAAGLLFTAPGVPMIFMGQEMLEDTKFVNQPAPLDWSKSVSNAGVRAFYKDIIRLRRNLDGTSAGLRGKSVAVTHFNDSPGNKVLAYRRWSSANDDVVVIVNLGATRYSRYDVGVPAGDWKVRLDSDATKYGADFGTASPTAVLMTATAKDNLPASAGVTLAPYSLVVLSR